VPVLAVGLMSGTSMDGVDAALIETDGEAHVRPLGFLSVPYDAAMKAKLRRAMDLALAADGPRHDPELDTIALDLTVAHDEAVTALLEEAGVVPEDVAVVGFHGQTVAHRPERGWTWQIGRGDVLARLCGIDVVDDFRSADVAAGGQGAPLVPAYHRALAGADGEAVGVLNLGGVGNLTWFGTGGAVIAFDTGPGNALIDDWMRQHGAGDVDLGGAVAGGGRVDETVLTAMLDNMWFDLPPPKSLDRHDFDAQAARGLSLADGAATLTAFTAETVRIALRHMPEPTMRLLVTGGGRHNATLMRMMAERLNMAVEPVEARGWNGDALEAEAFAYLAVRVLSGLPTSFPETTGVPFPVCGGRVSKA
jgi:anhydro-N-acetylmuramic acid kinase